MKNIYLKLIGAIILINILLCISITSVYSVDNESEKTNVTEEHTEKISSENKKDETTNENSMEVKEKSSTLKDQSEQNEEKELIETQEEKVNQHTVTSLESGIIDNSGKLGIAYKGYIENVGMSNWKLNDALVGTEGKGRGLSGIQLQLTNAPSNAKIEYMVLKDSKNGKEWTSWNQNGDYEGFQTNGKNIYAIRIRLKNLNNYSVEYRVHRQYQGWESNYVADGDIAGKQSINSRIEGIKIRIVPKISKTPQIIYRGYIDKQGYQKTYAKSDMLVGTENKGIGLNGIKMELLYVPQNAKIEYQVLKDDKSNKKIWTNWINNGELAGFEESGKNIYAIRIRLKNLDNYSVEYRVHRQYQGWESNYVADGDIAGKQSINSRIEGVKIRIVPKISKKPQIIYRGYIDKQGYQIIYSKDDLLTGTENKGIGLNGIKMELLYSPKKARIEYQVLKDNQTGGKIWTKWISDFELAGFEENGKNIYAIKIRLKNMPNYSVEYRVHRKYQGWESRYEADGEVAGSEYTDSRIEGIKIRIVPKRKKPVELKYKGFVESIGYQDYARDDKLSGTESKGLALRGVIIELKNAPANAGIEYQAYADTAKGGKEWQPWKNSGELSGWEQAGKNIYAIRIKLRNMPNYSVEYRVHRQYQGWEPNYIADGGIAGTENTNSRLEGIKIRIVPKKTVSVSKQNAIEQGTYGKSGLKIKGHSAGSDLKYYKFGTGINVFFACFAIHGFEDSYDHDGVELTYIAEEFKNYLLNTKDTSILNKWTIYILPSLNPDGEYYGWNKNGEGRTTLYSAAPNHKGIDMNRGFSVGFSKQTSTRNYNGTEPFQAYEARYLRDFLLNKKSKSGQTVLIDLHGWLNETLGDNEIGSYYRSQFGLSKHISAYGQGYLINWARSSLGNSNRIARSSLVELPQVYNHSQVVNKKFAEKYINATVNMLKSTN